MKKRKNFDRWVHNSDVPLKSMLSGITTLCGKTARRINSSKVEKEITCPLCLEKMNAIKQVKN